MEKRKEWKWAKLFQTVTIEELYEVIKEDMMIENTG